MGDEQLADLRQLWHDQCEAARNIINNHGWESAIGYLIGEKFVHFITYDLENWPELNDDLPAFVSEIKDIFSKEELGYYLSSVRNLGALGHIFSSEQHEEMAVAGFMEDGPETWAENALIIERLKELLLD